MRSTYICKEKTPYLYSLSESSFRVKKIIPSLGFCERAEILTGSSGEKTGLFTAIERNKQNSEYTSRVLLYVLELLYKVFDFGISVTRSYFLFRAKKKVIKTVLSYFYPEAKMPPFNIPPMLLEKMALSEDFKDHSKPDAFNTPSLIDLSFGSDISFNFDAFTYLGDKSNLNTDKLRMENLIENLKKSDDSVFFLYIGVLDAMGHEYGPDSNEFDQELVLFDQQIKEFINSIRDISDCNIMLIGDHGMSTVQSTIDFKKILDESLKTLNIDKNSVDLFCDSTLGRVWIEESEKKDIILRQLRKCSELNEKGRFLEKEDYFNLNIPYKPQSYGDIIWLANNGIMISPDYFHGPFPTKGMHGYNPDNIETYGTLIVYGEDIAREEVEFAHLADVNSIIKEKMLLNRL